MGAVAKKAEWLTMAARGGDAGRAVRAGLPQRAHRTRFWAVEHQPDNAAASPDETAGDPPGAPPRGEGELFYTWDHPAEELRWPPTRTAAAEKAAGVIEILLSDGVRVRVDNAVDAVALRRVLNALQTR